MSIYDNEVAQAVRTAELRAFRDKLTAIKRIVNAKRRADMGRFLRTDYDGEPISLDDNPAYCAPSDEDK